MRILNTPMPIIFRDHYITIRNVPYICVIRQFVRDSQYHVLLNFQFTLRLLIFMTQILFYQDTNPGKSQIIFSLNKCPIVKLLESTSVYILLYNVTCSVIDAHCNPIKIYISRRWQRAAVLVGGILIGVVEAILARQYFLLTYYSFINFRLNSLLKSSY